MSLPLQYVLHFFGFFLVALHEDHNLTYLVVDVSEKQKWFLSLIMKGGSANNFKKVNLMLHSFPISCELYHWFRVRILELSKLIFFRILILAPGVIASMKTRASLGGLDPNARLRVERKSLQHQTHWLALSTQKWPFSLNTTKLSSGFWLLTNSLALLKPWLKTQFLELEKKAIFMA